MKIGDIIARKDMPQLKEKIVGESKDWNAWEVISLWTSPFKEDRKRYKKGSISLVFKDDDRWFVVADK